MEKEKVYLEEIGWCYEITTNRYNESGINEPYLTYELVENNKK